MDVWRYMYFYSRMYTYLHVKVFIYCVRVLGDSAVIILEAAIIHVPYVQDAILNLPNPNIRSITIPLDYVWYEQ